MPPKARAIPILLCIVIGFAGIAASLGAESARDDREIVAVFPPWWPASRTLSAASDAGAVVDSGAFSFVLVVQAQSPELGGRLRAAGALLLLNPLGLGGCLKSSARNQNV